MEEAHDASADAGLQHRRANGRVVPRVQPLRPSVRRPLGRSRQRRRRQRQGLAPLSSIAPAPLPGETRSRQLDSIATRTNLPKSGSHGPISMVTRKKMAPLLWVELYSFCHFFHLKNGIDLKDSYQLTFGMKLETLGGTPQYNLCP